MITWGINALNHGSSIAVFERSKLILFEQSKNDELDLSIVNRALDAGSPDTIYWYEQPWVKKARQAYAGQWHRVFDLNDLPKRYLRDRGLGYADLKYTAHHASHAAAGYYTSPFNHCAVVVLDAIGEFECATIWEGRNGELKKLWSSTYPQSLGLFYSAFTDLIGLEPVVEEHILEKYSYLGNSQRFYKDVKYYLNQFMVFTENLHKGVRTWPYKIESDRDRYDIAAAVQRVFEEQVDLIMTTAKSITGNECLVYMGGCAMNRRYNQRLKERWKYVWSLPQPGDASSSIGAVLYQTKQRISNYDFGVVKHLEISV